MLPHDHHDSPRTEYWPAHILETLLSRKSDRTYRTEYWLVRLLCLPLQWLPYRAALGGMWVLAHIAYLFMHARRAEALRRIHEVFGNEITPRRARRIARLSWRNIAFSFVDLLRMPRMRREWVMKMTDHEQTVATLKTLHEGDHGYILALPHMGSWEMAATTVRHHGLPLFSIGAEQRNPYTTDYINRLRASSGAPLLLRGRSAIREVVERLRKGEILAILPDLRHRTPALNVPFLGGQANVAEGMAAFARKADVPIVPCYVTREGWTRHVFHLTDPVTPAPRVERKQDVARMTAEVMNRLTDVICEHPEQWFWYNRRWVLDPLEPRA